MKYVFCLHKQTNLWKVASTYAMRTPTDSIGLIFSNTFDMQRNRKQFTMGVGPMHGPGPHQRLMESIDDHEISEVLGLCATHLLHLRSGPIWAIDFACGE